MITTLAHAVHADPVAEYDAKAFELAQVLVEHEAATAALAVALPLGPMAMREPLERLRRATAALPELEVRVRDLLALRDEHQAHADRARQAEVGPLATRIATGVRAHLAAAAALLKEGSVSVDRPYGARPGCVRFVVVSDALAPVADMAERLDGGAA